MKHKQWRRRRSKLKMSKIDLVIYFTLQFRSNLDLKSYWDLKGNASKQFQKEISNIRRRSSCSSTYAEHGHFSYKHLQRTCTPTLLLIISFVWRRPRCRWRRGLLKLPKLPEVRPIYFRNQLIAGTTDYESSWRMQSFSELLTLVSTWSIQPVL